MDKRDNLKDTQVSHWDLDYMTDAQREAWLAEQDRKRHVDAARVQTPDTLQQPDTQSLVDWRWTGLAAVVVAAMTFVLWLVTVGPLA